MASFVSADLHLGHALMAEKRGFTDVHAMNKRLIEEINDIVAEDDHYYHVGDFCWGDPRRFLAQLNCRNLYFVIGSHDQKLEKMWEEDEMVLRLRASGKCAIKACSREIHVPGFHAAPVVLHHTPLLSWERSHYGSCSLYGHHHHGVIGGNTPLGQVGHLWGEQAKAFCVSVDNDDCFRPFPFAYAVEMANSYKGFLLNKKSSASA